jgi:hypothetical protein
MRNPKAWSGATPYGASGKIDKSSSGRSEGNSSNSRGHAHPTRPWKATGMNSNGPTPDSLAIDPIPASTSTHPNLSIKQSTASPSYGPGAKMIGAPKSGEKTFSMDPKEDMPKKWMKRYDLQGGAGVVTSGGKARKAPNK